MTRIERFGWRGAAEPGIGRIVSAHGDYYHLVCNEAEGEILARKKKSAFTRMKTVAPDSMKGAIGETNRRRRIQQAYNDAHGITPTSIKKAVRDLIAISHKVESSKKSWQLEKDPESMTEKELKALISEVTKRMHQAAVELNFEEAAVQRDRMLELKKYLK